MRLRTILIVCVVLTAGALYGRFQFLRDRGMIAPETTFFQYLARQVSPPAKEDAQAKRAGEPADASPDRKPRDEKAEEIREPEKPTAPPSKATETPPARPASSEQKLKEARRALAAGDLEECLGKAAGLDGPEAAELRYHATLVRHMVTDVAVDPGASAPRIYRVTLANGNVLHAVAADRTPTGWELRLADGIGCTLDEGAVASVSEEKPDSFRKDRLAELRSRLKQLGTGGVYERWKAIRLAWRRGFPAESCRVFKELADVPKALEALAIVLPPEKEAAIAKLREEVLLASAVAQARPESPTADASAGTEGTERPAIERPPALTQAAEGPADASFKDIDRRIGEAREKIRAALAREGAEADRLIREAGLLLASVRKDLDGGQNLPRGEAYNQRLTKVTLLLEDFLKMSSFGITKDE